jgi:hypothetical protein
MRTRRLPPIVVPVELLDAARAAGTDCTNLGELVRLGLARIAGVDPDDERYRTRRPGRPPTRRRSAVEVTCAACGAVWRTWAEQQARCPACGHSHQVARLVEREPEGEAACA